MEQAVRSSARHAGHALIGTMIFLVLSMLLFAAMHQQVASHLRVEKTLRVRTERADRLKRAAAWGLSLLETGQPLVGPDSAYRCRMVLDGQVYLATFHKTSTSGDPPVYQLATPVRSSVTCP